MRRPAGAFLIVSAILAAGVGGLIVGRSSGPLPGRLDGVVPAAAKQSQAPTEATGPVIYYRDPDGLPNYSLTPRKSSAGKDFIAVRASEDVSFEEKTPETTTAKGGDPKSGERGKIRYYRNPMGLPDTSPTPKKDSMGMDYIAVYDDEDASDGTVRISPGKLQRTGVRTEQVERRVLSAPVRAPGTIQLDERRVSIVAFRFEGFIEHVEDVTTGQH